jgi:hypothetical protein
VFDEAVAARVDARRLSEDLFGVAATIHGSASLRRALTDPTREGAAKSDLAVRVFGGKVGEEAQHIVATLVGRRWSSERDLVDSIDIPRADQPAIRANWRRENLSNGIISLAGGGITFASICSRPMTSRGSADGKERWAVIGVCSIASIAS